MSHHCLHLVVRAMMTERHGPVIIVDAPREIETNITELVKLVPPIKLSQPAPEDNEPELAHFTPWQKHPPPSVHLAIRQEHGTYG